MSAVTRLLVVSWLLVLVGCGPVRDQAVDSEQVDGLMTDQSFDVAGELRRYHLFVPDDPAHAPIVLLLHGNGGSADQILGLDGTPAPYRVWLDIAARENVLLVVPDGAEGPNDKQGWNDCRADATTNPTSDDETVLTSLLDGIQARFGAGAGQVFVTGTSNGGGMAQRLADVIPERLDAIAVVAAARPVNTECGDSAAPLPVLFMNGTEDPILPYDGGRIGADRGLVMSTSDTVAYWVRRNRSTLPVRTDVADVNSDDDSTVVRTSYQGGDDGATVEHYEVVNGGHTEPSIAERYSRLFKRIVGEQNGDVEMAEEIWTFFDSQ